MNPLPLDSKKPLDDKQVRLDSDHGLLELGRQTLHQLTAQAEAARTEARRIELELLLNQADNGDIEPLRRWFQTISTLSTKYQPTPRQPTDSQATDSQATDSQATDSQATDSQATDSQPGDGPLPSVEKSTVVSSGKVVRRDSASFRNRPATEASPRQLAPVDASARATSPTAEVAIERKPKRKRSGVGGLIFSTLVHLLLAIGLGLITIQIPAKEILGLQSSTSPEAELDTIEVTTPVDISTPNELTEPASTSLTSDMASAFSDLGPTTSQALDSLSAATSVATSADRAMSATTSDLPKNAGVTFYGTSAAGNCFCFLIDGSATLRGAPWEAARTELLRSLMSLQEKQRFYVLFYNKTIHRLPDPLSNLPSSFPLYATPENLRFATAWIQSLQVEPSIPGGNHKEVLQVALELEPDAIFYLTDGQMSPKILTGVLEMLRQSNRVDDLVEGEIVRVPIHAIAFYDPQWAVNMQTIAAENQGQFNFVPDPNPDSKSSFKFKARK
ncbi:MAG: hypothetical protein KF752_14730 [Pirellulaceae bacterium]|nr:hypothetical protein [Pirellulaceae bacterium]